MKIFNLFTTSSSIVCIPYVNTFERLFYFIALRNKEGAMSFFKFLFNLYLTFIEVSGKIRSISWLLCNIGKSFFKKILVLGSIGLHCIIELHEVRFSGFLCQNIFNIRKYFFGFGGFIISNNKIFLVFCTTFPKFTIRITYSS